MESGTETFTGFSGSEQIASGDLATVAVALKPLHDAGRPAILILHDERGEPVDVDFSGSPEELAERLRRGSTAAVPQRAGRGRPRLGVTAREVTLLPRHWDWLSQQPGGASAALRRLVDAARRTDEGAHRSRQARDAAYRAMHVLAGDLPGFEEAARALFAGDMAGVLLRMERWPLGIRTYLQSRLEVAARLESGETDGEQG